MNIPATRLAALFLLLSFCAACRMNDKPGGAGSKSPASASREATIPTQQAAPAAAAATPLAKPDQAIRDADIRGFLDTHYAEVDSGLANLQEQCDDGRSPVSVGDVDYSDLDGDGQEEALFQGYTCVSGSSGMDFWGVLKQKADGNLFSLRFAPVPETFKGRNPKAGLRGHVQLTIENGRVVENCPVYKEGDCEACAEGNRKFVYRWDGQKFVLDDIIDPPPEKKGNQPAN